MAITTSYDEYLERAKKEYDPTYNAKVDTINNALNSNLTILEGQKTGINANYDNQAKDQNYQNTLNKNNYDAINSARGLGRSTILTTGLAGMDDRNSQILGQIQQARTNALGNIDSQKAALQTNANTDITTLQNDRQSVLATLIKGYENDDIAKNERDREYNFRVDQAAKDEAFRQQQAAQAKADSDRNYALSLSAAKASAARASSGGGGSSSAKANTASKVNTAWTRFYQEIDDGTASQWLKENRSELVNGDYGIGNAEYQKMLDYLKDADIAYQLKQNKIKASQKVSGGGRMLADIFD